MHRIIINEYEIEKAAGFLERNVIDKDNWKMCGDGGDIDACSAGVCVIDENDRKCICTDGFDAVNCQKG